MQGARRMDEESQHECPVCGAEDYVLYDDDKMCGNCGHAPDASTASLSSASRTQSWEEWVEHRRDSEDYEGWFGGDRIKFVGGFVGAYDL